MVMSEQQFDAVIVGGGGAGLEPRRNSLNRD